MYSDLFSKVYDVFGWNYYPETFAQLLLRWIKENDLEIHTMLDLGCGTGVLCSILQEHGIQCKGMDLSHGMIAMAKEKYPQIPFEQGNMVTWNSKASYDLVTSTCDAVNHILEPEDVKQVMKQVHSYLNDGGYFLFDLLRENEAQECEPVNLGEWDGKRLEFQIYHPKEKLVTLQADLFECQTDLQKSNNAANTEIQENSSSERKERRIHTEKIQERIYDPEWVMEIIREAGFSQVCCRDQLLKEESGHAATWFVIARK